MKAEAKLYRKLESGELRPVSKFMSDACGIELLDGDNEEALVKVMHGSFVEAEVTVKMIGFGRVSVMVRDKKSMERG